MAELLGPQTVPDLSLSVPRLSSGAAIAAAVTHVAVSKEPIAVNRASSSSCFASSGLNGGRSLAAPCSTQPSAPLPAAPSSKGQGQVSQAMAEVSSQPRAGFPQSPTLSPSLWGPTPRLDHAAQSGDEGPRLAASSTQIPMDVGYARMVPTPQSWVDLEDCRQDNRLPSRVRARSGSANSLNLRAEEPAEELHAVNFPSTLRGLGRLQRAATGDTSRSRLRPGARRQTSQKGYLDTHDGMRNSAPHLNREPPPYHHGGMEPATASGGLNRGAQRFGAFLSSGASPPHHASATHDTSAEKNGESPPWRPPGRAPVQSGRGKGQHSRGWAQSCGSGDAGPSDDVGTPAVRSLQLSMSPPPCRAPASGASPYIGSRTGVPLHTGSDQGRWPLLREPGFEPLGPMLRSLEFQVSALFELMDAHLARDLADHSVTDVISQKRELVMETFDAVKDALWGQQRKVLRPERIRSLGNGGSLDVSQVPVHSSCDQTAGGLRDLEALQSQLARRVAAVVDDGPDCNINNLDCSAPSSIANGSIAYSGRAVSGPDRMLGHGDLERMFPSAIGTEYTGASSISFLDEASAFAAGGFAPCASGFATAAAPWPREPVAAYAMGVPSAGAAVIAPWHREPVSHPMGTTPAANGYGTYPAGVFYPPPPMASQPCAEMPGFASPMMPGPQMPFYPVGTEQAPQVHVMPSHVMPCQMPPAVSQMPSALHPGTVVAPLGPFTHGAPTVDVSSAETAQGDRGEVAHLRAQLTSMLEVGESFKKDAQDALRRLDASGLSVQDSSQRSPDPTHATIAGARVGAVSMTSVAGRAFVAGPGALHMASIAGNALMEAGSDIPSGHVAPARSAPTRDLLSSVASAGEPLQATALAPLVLTPTNFHYKSPA